MRTASEIIIEALSSGEKSSLKPLMRTIVGIEQSGDAPEISMVRKDAKSLSSAQKAQAKSEIQKRMGSLKRKIAGAKGDQKMEFEDRLDDLKAVLKALG